MKKVTMLAAMLAMMMVAAAPAIAQDTNVGGDQYNTEISDNTVITQTQAAELVQDCRTIVTVNQTGTATGGDQYNDDGDNNQVVTAEIGDANVTVTGAACQQILNQVQAGDDAAGAVTAVLGGASAAPAAGAVAPAAPAAEEAAAVEGVDAAEAEAAAEAAAAAANNGASAQAVAAAAAEAAAAAGATGAEADAAAAAAAGAVTGADSDALGVLPDTGGISLLTLGAGALLVAGGLLARRIVR